MDLTRGFALLAVVLWLTRPSVVAKPAAMPQIWFGIESPGKPAPARSRVTLFFQRDALAGIESRSGHPFGLWFSDHCAESAALLEAIKSISRSRLSWTANTVLPRIGPVRTAGEVASHERCGCGDGASTDAAEAVIPQSRGAKRCLIPPCDRGRPKSGRAALSCRPYRRRSSAIP
jgi:hypothetical protein